MPTARTEPLCPASGVILEHANRAQRARDGNGATSESTTADNIPRTTGEESAFSEVMW